MANDIGPAALVTGCTDETYGYFEDIRVSDGVEKKEARNGAGDIVGVNFHANMKTLTATYIFRTATGNPQAQVGSGTAVTFTDTDLGSGNWYVITAEDAKTQGDYYRQTITAEQYPDLAS